MNHQASPILARASLIVLAACLLAACGKSDTKPVESSQVAAKVDGTEISVHQIDYVLKRSKLAPDSPQAAKALRQQVLTKLVDQQLLVQKALEDKLDRSPDVQMGMEAARRDVLSDAYLQQANGTQIPASEAEVRKYFVEHPQLFSDRRVFVLEETGFGSTAPAEVVAAVKTAVEAGKTSEEAVRILSAAKVPFGRNDIQRASEQVSLELLPSLYKLRPGQGVFVAGPQSTTLVYVKSYQEAPVGEAVAMPRIAQFLANQKLSQSAGELLKNLRSKAKIEYVGEFSGNTPEASK